MEYSFDIKMAEEFGVEEAIMIKNFQFWILKNQANDKNFFDGHHWTYNSITAFSKLYPFWSEKQIRRILKSLRDQEVLIVGNYNKNKYDRTLWYAFKNESIFLNELIDSPKWANEKDQTGEPIPDNKPYKKPVVKPNKEVKHEVSRIPAYIDLVTLLITKISNNDPHYFDNKNMKSLKDRWYKSIRLMIEKDNRSLGEVKEVIEWCQDNSFWRSNILSAKKLRDKFTTLLLQMKTEQNKNDKDWYNRNGIGDIV